MRLPRRTLWLSLFLAFAVAGCATPVDRAKSHPAAFRKLSPADQNLVLEGRVRDGMSADAVYIAWGDPDSKKSAAADVAGKDAKDGVTSSGKEVWYYERQLAVQSPMNSFDQWLPGNNLWGMTVPWTVNSGAGFGGTETEGTLLLQPHLRVVDAQVKRAEFVNGKLARWDMRQGNFAIAP